MFLKLVPKFTICVGDPFFKGPDMPIDCRADRRPSAGELLYKINKDFCINNRNETSSGSGRSTSKLCARFEFRRHPNTPSDPRLVSYVTGRRGCGFSFL